MVPIVIPILVYNIFKDLNFKDGSNFGYVMVGSVAKPNGNVQKIQHLFQRDLHLYGIHTVQLWIYYVCNHIHKLISLRNVYAIHHPAAAITHTAWHIRWIKMLCGENNTHTDTHTTHFFFASSLLHRLLVLSISVTSS